MNFSQDTTSKSFVSILLTDGTVILILNMILVCFCSLLTFGGCSGKSSVFFYGGKRWAPMEAVDI